MPKKKKKIISTSENEEEEEDDGKTNGLSTGSCLTSHSPVSNSSISSVEGH